MSPGGVCHQSSGELGDSDRGSLQRWGRVGRGETSDLEDAGTRVQPVRISADADPISPAEGARRSWPVPCLAVPVHVITHRANRIGAGALSVTSEGFEGFQSAGTA